MRSRIFSRRSDSWLIGPGVFGPDEMLVYRWFGLKPDRRHPSLPVCVSASVNTNGNCSRLLPPSVQHNSKVDHLLQTQVLGLQVIPMNPVLSKRFGPDGTIRLTSRIRDGRLGNSCWISGYASMPLSGRNCSLPFSLMRPMRRRTLYGVHRKY